MSGEWIPVSERWPDDETELLVAFEDRSLGVAFAVFHHLDENERPKWTDGNGVELKEPSHWMPLPAPPTDAKFASAGSVASEPVAWAVMVGGRRMYVSWCKEMCEDEAYYHRHPLGDSVSVVPLYRQHQDGVVRLPPLDTNGAPGWNAAIGAVREALAEAGVDWDTE